MSLMSTAASQCAEPGTSLRERIINADSDEQRVPGNVHCAVDVHAGNPSQQVAQSFELSVENVVDPALNISYERSRVKILLLCLWTWIYTKGMQTFSIGVFPASNWYYYLFHCTPDEGVTRQTKQEYLTRWETALRSISRSWKDTQSNTSSILLVSALTILQLDDVLNNRVICTFMAAAILLALASILTSFIYLLSKENFISRWKTSEGLDTSFWRCISMPLDFAIWSFIFFISTVFILIYQRMLPTQANVTIAQGAINSPEPVGAAVVAILSVATVLKIYHGMKYFYRKK
ncbi:hypothetical protein CPC08DRAFT_801144 [Agrocybe pediades]|nr:hypothetical protein CPC08DRAFT_801144 [Agrocybe pediades]